MAAVIVRSTPQDWYKAAAPVIGEEAASNVISNAASEFWESRDTHLKMGGTQNAQEALLAFYDTQCHLRLAKDGNRVVGGYAVLLGTKETVWMDSEDGDFSIWLHRDADGYCV